MKPAENISADRGLPNGGRPQRPCSAHSRCASFPAVVARRLLALATAFSLCLGALVVDSASATQIRIGPLTNSIGGGAATNDVIVYAVGTADANGYYSAQGTVKRFRLSSDGSFTNYFEQNNYIYTNKDIGMALGFGGFPQDSGPTVYAASDWIIPGKFGALNFFVTRIFSGGTNGTITFNQITNGLGFLPLTPLQVTNAILANGGGGSGTATNITGNATNQVLVISTNVVQNNAWALGGNDGAGKILGTTNSTPLYIVAGNQTGIVLTAFAANDIRTVIGVNNTISSSGSSSNRNASILGGQNNNITGQGFPDNEDGRGQVIVNGDSNTNLATGFGFIGTGYKNTLHSDPFETVLNGNSNSVISTSFGTILNGDRNTINGNVGFSTYPDNGAEIILSGTRNTNGGSYSIIGNGINNSLLGFQLGTFPNCNVILNGTSNLLQGYYSTILNGIQNKIYGLVTGGSIGNNNFISGGVGNIIKSGYGNSIISGVGDTVSNANYSTLIGYGANATNDFVTVISDGSAFFSKTNGEFAVHASGGIRLVTGGVGATLDGSPIATSSSIASVAAGTNVTVQTNGTIYTVNANPQTNAVVFTNQFVYATNYLATNGLAQLQATNAALQSLINTLGSNATNNDSVVSNGIAARFIPTNALPGLTNGFITAAITNGFATTNFVNTQVATASNALAASVITASNLLQTTKQPAAANLTNWSALATGSKVDSLNGVVTNMAAWSTLSFGSNVLLTLTTNDIGMNGAGSGVANGTYRLFSGSFWTNITGATISYSAPNYLVQSNGITLYTATSLYGAWSIVSGVSAVPTSYVGGEISGNGVVWNGYFSSTNLNSKFVGVRSDARLNSLVVSNSTQASRIILDSTYGQSEISSGNVTFEEEGIIRFATGTNAQMLIDSGENNSLKFRSDSWVSFDADSYSFTNGDLTLVNGWYFVGSGRLNLNSSTNYQSTNLIGQVPTTLLTNEVVLVSAGSNALVTISNTSTGKVATVSGAVGFLAVTNIALASAHTVIATNPITGANITGSITNQIVDANGNVRYGYSPGATAIYGAGNQNAITISTNPIIGILFQSPDATPAMIITNGGTVVIANGNFTGNIGGGTNLPYAGLSAASRLSVTNAALGAAQAATNAYASTVTNIANSVFGNSTNLNKYTVNTNLYIAGRSQEEIYTNWIWLQAFTNTVENTRYEWNSTMLQFTNSTIYSITNAGAQLRLVDNSGNILHFITSSSPQGGWSDNLETGSGVGDWGRLEDFGIYGNSGGRQTTNTGFVKIGGAASFSSLIVTNSTTLGTLTNTGAAVFLSSVAVSSNLTANGDTFMEGNGASGTVTEKVQNKNGAFIHTYQTTGSLINRDTYSYTNGAQNFPLYILIPDFTGGGGNSLTFYGQLGAIGGWNGTNLSITNIGDLASASVSNAQYATTAVMATNLVSGASLTNANLTGTTTIRNNGNSAYDWKITNSSSGTPTLTVQSVGASEPGIQIKGTGEILAPSYGGFYGNGTGLTNVAGTNLVGTIPDARLSTNVTKVGSNAIVTINFPAGLVSTMTTNANGGVVITLANTGITASIASNVVANLKLTNAFAYTSFSGTMPTNSGFKFNYSNELANNFGMQILLTNNSGKVAGLVWRDGGIFQIAVLNTNVSPMPTAILYSDGIDGVGVFSITGSAASANVAYGLDLYSFGGSMIDAGGAAGQDGQIPIGESGNGGFNWGNTTDINVGANHIIGTIPAANLTNATTIGLTIQGDASGTNWWTFNASGETKTNSGTGNNSLLTTIGAKFGNSNNVVQTSSGNTSTGGVMQTVFNATTNGINISTNWNLYHLSNGVPVQILDANSGIAVLNGNNTFIGINTFTNRITLVAGLFTNIIQVANGEVDNIVGSVTGWKTNIFYTNGNFAVIGDMSVTGNTFSTGASIAPIFRAIGNASFTVGSATTPTVTYAGISHQFNGAVTVTGLTTVSNLALSSTAAPVFNGNSITNINATNVSGTFPSSAIPYRSGITNIGNLSTSQPVLFSTPFSPSVGTNYSVWVTFDTSLGAAVNAATTSKTTNGFTISLSAGIAGSTTVDYGAFPYQ